MRYIKDGVVKTKAEIRGLYPNTSFSENTYSELGWEVYTEVPPIIEDSYIYNRVKHYGSISDQLDMIYWDNKNGTTKWVNHIEDIKSKYPKVL